MIKNQVGLEAEYLLFDGAVPVSPNTYGLGTDDFPMLGEVRGDPGATREETVANFLKGWYAMRQVVDRKMLTIGLTGYVVLPPEEYAHAMRTMGSKEIPQCKNIHGTDLLTHSNQLTKKGVVTGVVVSAGLHVHFSSSDTKKRDVSKQQYEAVTLPLAVGGADTYLSLYRKTDVTTEGTIEVSVSRITKPVVEFIVEGMDKLLASYPVNTPNKGVRHALKYRQPGYYELKRYGFEYRSLPFTQRVLDNLWPITCHAYELLEAL